jgi:hypothetical protein
MLDTVTRMVLARGAIAARDAPDTIAVSAMEVVMSRSPLPRFMLTGVIALSGLGFVVSAGRAHDAAKYPDWRGMWVRVGAATYDPTRPAALGQQAPLTPEYKAVHEASVVAQDQGGQGNDWMGLCIPPGMPRMMIGYGGIEIIIGEKFTMMVFADPMRQYRRIYTDGRDWPAEIRPSYAGYSIGRWEDADGDGRYDTLVVETRGMKHPRSYESSGIPLHEDNQAVIKEKFYVDPANPKQLNDEITVVDSALTRPWSVKRTYGLEQPAWFEAVCEEDDHHVRIGKEDYYLSTDKRLMPTRADQPAPDLRNFNPPSR